MRAFFILVVNLFKIYLFRAFVRQYVFIARNAFAQDAFFQRRIRISARSMAYDDLCSSSSSISLPYFCFRASRSHSSLFTLSSSSLTLACVVSSREDFSSASCFLLSNSRAASEAEMSFTFTFHVPNPPKARLFFQRPIILKRNERRKDLFST